MNTTTNTHTYDAEKHDGSHTISPDDMKTYASFLKWAIRRSKSLLVTDTHKEV